MTDHWIVVADASRARVLSTTNGRSEPLLVHDLNYPLSRSRSQDLVSDEPGRIDKGGRGVLSAMDPPTDPHEQQAKRFALQIADLLDKATARREFQGLTIVAPAHFLGLLNASLSTQTTKLLIGRFSKDLTKLELPQLTGHLRELIPSNEKGPMQSGTFSY